MSYEFFHRFRDLNVEKVEYQLDKEKLGLKIKELRVRQGITQETLAAICEIDTRTIQRIEKGQQNITLNILFNIANAIEMKPHEMLKSSYKN